MMRRQPFKGPGIVRPRSVAPIRAHWPAFGGPLFPIPVVKRDFGANTERVRIGRFVIGPDVVRDR